jgi:hypothetical protein
MIRNSFIIVILFLLFITASHAQQPSPVQFPQSFVGNWKGTLEWYKAGDKEPQKITMELRVQPAADTAGQYTWNIIYGSVTADNRPYILKPVDTAKGHWIIDEVNGILLDQYWIGGKFHGAFTVENNTIVNNYWIENGNLYVEFVSYPAKPLATTGKGSEDSPFVNSYNIKAWQKAVLKKQ